MIRPVILPVILPLILPVILELAIATSLFLQVELFAPMRTIQLVSIHGTGHIGTGEEANVTIILSTPMKSPRRAREEPG